MILILEEKKIEIENKIVKIFIGFFLNIKLNNKLITKPKLSMRPESSKPDKNPDDLKLKNSILY